MWIMAFGALVGGVDRVCGNRLGLGERFEEGFKLLGPIALSMVGILCLEPLISNALSGSIGASLAAIGHDPGMLGSLLAIDMGGYPLAVGLSIDPAVGRYAGVIASAIFGCTISFTIPVGMGMLDKTERDDLAQGMLFGLIAMPAALLLGGVLSGLSAGKTLVQSLPLIALSAALLMLIRFAPRAAIRGFSGFAWLLKAIITLGLALGAFQAMTGVKLVSGLMPIEEGMAVASSIGVVLLGSLPVAELVQRALKKPFQWLGKRTGMNEAGVAGLLLTMVSVLPTLALFPKMDRKSRVVNAAAMVSTTSALSAHLGFVAGVDAAMITPLLMTKLVGGAIGVVLALLFTRKNVNS